MRPRLVLFAALAVLAAPGAVRAQNYFGQNKVQYRTFDWKVIETEHFLVHYYGPERRAALDAARMAERAYARLSRILAHEFREKKPLILYASNSDFVQTNVTPEDIGEGTGGFTEFYRHRMVMPFTGSYADFEHVLQHEMVHAFQYDVFSRGRAGGGFQTISAINPPLWFMEGMAEYLSIGPVDPHTAMWMRDAALNGKMPTLDQLNNDTRFFPYRYGHALWAYVGQKWGDESIGAILQGTMTGGVDRAFQRVLGITLEQLIEEWTAAVQDTYLPQVPNQQRPRTFARAVANRRLSQGTYHIGPQVSPDGRYVAYLSERNFFFVDLYLADMDAPRNIRRLVSSAVNTNFESLRFIYSTGSWSPDGSEFVFAAKSGGEDVLNILDVRRRRVVQRLPLGFAGITNPSFSPDGQRLVFTGFVGGWTDLYVVDRDGQNLRRLTNDAYADLMPQWSPDGRSIAFTTDRGGRTDFGTLRFGNMRIALYWLDGDSITVLPRMDEGKNINPVWAPDGQSLAFVSDRSGINNLFLYDFATRDVYQLTRAYTGITGITDLSPAISWARGADRLVMTYYEDGQYNVYAMDNPRSLRREPYRGDPGTAVVLANASAQPLRAEYTLRALSRPPATDAPLVSAAAPASQPPGLLPGPTQQPAAPTPSTSPGGAGAQPAPGAAPSGASIYRGPSGAMRPSDTQPGPAPAGQPAPLSVAALLDSAQLALPDTLEFTMRDYRPRYAADLVSRPTIGYARDNFGRGVFGGAAVQFTDLLGDHSITAAGMVNGRIEEAQLFLAYTNLARRINWAVGGAQEVYYYYQQGTYTPTQQFDVYNQAFTRLIARSAFGLAMYPLTRFNRIEVRNYVINISQATLNQISTVDPNTGQVVGYDENITSGISRTYVLPSVAYVHDNSLFGWTSPFYGGRYRLEASQAVGQIRYTQGLVDWRRYFMIAFPWTFATRVTAIGRFGRDEDYFPLFLGTPDRVRGYTYGSLLDHECRAAVQGLVQGCPELDQLIGSRMVVASAEFRFPLFRTLLLGFAPVGLPPVEGALFYDAGIAWSHGNTLKWRRGINENSSVRAPVSSYGASVRLNLFGMAILSVDYAKPLQRCVLDANGGCSRVGGYWIVSLNQPF